LIISGLISGGFATAREWESSTVKELLLFASARWVDHPGKVLASSPPALPWG